MDWYMVSSVMLGFVTGMVMYSTEITKRKNIICAIGGAIIVVLINMGIWYFRSL